MLEHPSAPAATHSRTSTMPDIPCHCLVLAACDWRHYEGADLKLSDDDLGDKERKRKQATGFSVHLEQIVRRASEMGADTILFSPWTYTVGKNARAGELTHATLFPRGTKHQAVILGVRRREGRRYRESIEVHTRTSKTPYPMKQHFSKSTAPAGCKRSFAHELESSRCGDVTVIICGETNIIKTKRATKGVVDDYGVIPMLDKHNVRVILNPVHDFMRRPEMTRKRAFLSSNSRTVISIWNRGYKKGEAHVPWAAYRGRKDLPHAIKEVPVDFGWSVPPNEPGVRMGILMLR